MKNYRITVNGTAYDVAVEELGAGAAPVAAAPVAAAPVAAPAAPAAPAPAAGAGSVVVPSPMPGKILAVKQSVGASVKKGDNIVIIESMKMELEIKAPCDGKVHFLASAGTQISNGQAVAEIQ